MQRHPDELIYSLAAPQHGVVARAQLRAAGMPVHRVAYRVKTGRLTPLFRGVYRVGAVAGVRESEMAAVLACGDGAVLSHRSAAVLWGLLAPDREARVEVTIRRSCRRPGARVRVHRIPDLHATEITRLHGIPITTAARTLLDIAGATSAALLERALGEAQRRRLVRKTELERILARHRRASGRARLSVLVEGAAALTRSEAEARFLRLVRAGRLPVPEVNVSIAMHEVDFLWRMEGLVVEMDGFAWHSGRRAFENDRRRDAALVAAGLRVTRVTWRQLVQEHEALLVRLAQALQRHAA